MACHSWSYGLATVSALRIVVVIVKGDKNPIFLTIYPRVGITRLRPARAFIPV